MTAWPWLLGLLLLAGCGDDPKTVTPQAREASASRPAGDGVAPETHAIVAREGDHLVVIIDVAPKDAQGRAVAKVSVDVDAPESAVKVSPIARSADLMTVEVRIPATTKSLKLVGTSDGGAAWSKVIPTDLDAR